MVRGLSLPLSVPNLAITVAPVFAVGVLFWIHLMSATQRPGESPPLFQVSRFAPWALIIVALVALPLALLVTFTTSRFGSTDSAIALVTVLGLLGIILLAVIKINWGLCAFLLLLPLGLVAHSAVRSTGLATDEMGYLIWNPEILLVLAAVSGVYLQSLRSRRDLVFSWLTPLLLLLLCWSFLSAALSTDPGYSVRVVMAGTLAPILVYYLVINSIRSRVDLKRTVYVLLLSFFLLGAYSLVRTFQLTPAEGILNGDVRVAPLLNNPDTAAGVLLLGVALSGALILSLSQTFQMRVAIIVIFAILVMVLIMTFTRGSWLAAGISLVVLFVLNSRFKKVVLLSLPALSVILYLAKDTLMQLALARTGSLEAFLHSDPYLGRLAAWDSAANMVLANPLVGIGPGLYRDFYRQFETGYYRIPFTDAHSLPLELASTSGIVAAVAFLAVAGIVLRWTYQIYRSSEDDLMKYTGLGLFVALVGYLAYAMTTGEQMAIVTENRLYFFGGHTYYLFMMFGLAGALHRLHRQVDKAGTERRPEMDGSIVKR